MALLKKIPVGKKPMMDIVKSDNKENEELKKELNYYILMLVTL